MAFTTNSPFNLRSLNDINYIVSTSLVMAPTPSLDFIQAVPYPTTTETTLLNVGVVLTNTNASQSLTSVTSSYFLQHSADNSTFVNVPQKAAPFILIQSVTGSAPISSSVLTSFEPDGKRYVRLSSSYSTGGTATGSLSLVVEF